MVVRPCPTAMNSVRLSAKRWRTRADLAEVIQRAVQKIECGEAVLLSDLAQQVGLSKHHLARLFRESVGVSPAQYATKCRIERAKQLLSGDETLTEIAVTVGYASLSAFSRAYKNLEGISPSEFRKKS